MYSPVPDVRLAFRALSKRPGFAAVAIVTLALGIGATTAMFTVVDAILIRPLPYPRPDRLVHLEIRGGDGNAYPLPDSDFVIWRSQADAFDAVAVYDDGTGLSLAGAGEPERIVARNVTAGFFAALEGSPAIGRVFEAGDDRPGAPRTVVLSHAFWQRHFHGDPQVVGRPIVLDGVQHTVIGVMPASFVFLSPDTDLWRALAIGAPARRGPFYSWGLARMKPQVTLGQAAASLDAVAATVKQRYPGAHDWSYRLVPLKDAVVGQTGRTLELLLGAVGFLLLIATANVANLLLARAASRDREMAVRGALGAGRSRLVAQLGVESLVLAAAGGLASLAIAAWGTHALLALAPEGIPRLHEVTMNGTVFLFAFGCAAATGVAFSIVPALRASRTPLVASLTAGGGRSATAGSSHRAVQRAIVVGEIATALVLAIGAGLMLRSFAALSRVSPGFATDHLATMRLNLPESRYDTDARIEGFYATLEAKLLAIPGVRAAAATISLPPDQLAVTDSFTAEGQVLPPGQSAPVAPLVWVDDAFFLTLGVPVVAGRTFDERDTKDKPLVVLVNQTLARRYFPGTSAVGRRLKIGGPERPTNAWLEIVGVVGDIKYEGLDAPPEPTFYLDFRQSPQTERFLVLRTAVDPSAIAPAMRAAVAAVDPGLAVASIRSMDDVMSRSVSPPRFRTALVTIFAAVGLVLATVGIYGVMAYMVAQRTNELGVRMALGAGRADVMQLVLGEAGALAAAGIALGLAGAWAGTRLMAALLFGLRPTDAATFTGVAALLVATALGAAWLPARRAARVDPVVALRQE